MRTKEELTSLIGKCEEKLKKMNADLEGYYAALEPKVAPLVEKSNEKEESKKKVEKKSLPGAK